MNATEMTLDAFAEMSVQMETSENPAKLMEERGVLLASWLREQRRWNEKTKADDEVRQSLEEAVAKHRAAQAQSLPRTEGGGEP